MLLQKLCNLIFVHSICSLLCLYSYFHSGFADFIQISRMSSKPNSLSSLRRTLSAADMSASSSSCPVINRTQSSAHLDQDAYRRQETDVNNNSDHKRGAFDDIWGSILSNKKNDSGSPYVHPLVKRTTSSLSDKSLEICTENLGSETGSDEFGFGFGSSDPEQQQPEFADKLAVAANLFSNNKIITAFETETKECKYRRGGPPPITPTKPMMMSASSFPPPLTSLSHSHHIRSRRHDGRLVLEAVSVPSTTTRFHALRRDGRLLLTLSSDPVNLCNNSYDVVDDQEKKQLALEFVMEEASIPSCRMIMSKVIGTQKWRPRNFNAAVIKDLDEEEDETAAPPPLQPLLPLPEITVLNAYEYYWRRSDVHCATVAVLKPVAGQPPQVVVKDINGNEKWVLGCQTKKITSQAQAQQEKQKVVVVVKAAAAGDEHLVPFLSGCKDSRMPLLPWKPYLIATT